MTSNETVIHQNPSNEQLNIYRSPHGLQWLKKPIPYHTILSYFIIWKSCPGGFSTFVVGAIQPLLKGVFTLIEDFLVISVITIFIGVIRWCFCSDSPYLHVPLTINSSLCFLVQLMLSCYLGFVVKDVTSINAYSSSMDDSLGSNITVTSGCHLPIPMKYIQCIHNLYSLEL